MFAIEINNVSKNYGEVKALEQINLSVKEGELFGLIGPDGAGKTSLFRILTTLLLPNEGSAIVRGHDVVKQYKHIRKIVGYMPGRFSLYQDLTVEENLSFFATIFKTTIKENYHLIKDIYQQIEPFKKRKAGALSGGMKQKLALSCALIHKPEVLFLDEPTTGVDAVSRKEFWEMLKRLQQKGITIFVSTPYMDEASLCDRIALIQNGKILSVDTPDQVISNYGKTLLAVKTNAIYQLIQDLRTHPKAVHVFPFGEFVHFTTLEEIDISQLANFLLDKNHQGIEINKIEASVEDCFMDLMEEEGIVS